MGTVYGAVVSTRWPAARRSSSHGNCLQDCFRLGADALQGVPWTNTALVSPDRWLPWLGVMFVVSVYHFPNGIVERLRAAGRDRRRNDA